MLFGALTLMSTVLVYICQGQGTAACLRSQLCSAILQTCQVGQTSKLLLCRLADLPELLLLLLLAFVLPSAAVAAAVLVAPVLVPVHFNAVALVILIARFAGLSSPFQACVLV